MSATLAYERKQLLRARLLACAAAPQGVTRLEMAKFTSTANGERSWLRGEIGRMLEAGELHAAADPQDGRRKVLFTTPEAGVAWVASLPPDRVNPWHAALAKRAATNAAKREARQEAKRTAYKPVPLTVSDKRRREGGYLPPGPVRSSALAASAPVIVPAGLVPQVLPGVPAWDQRYQVDPRTRVAGGFATMGPGRYLEDSRP